MHSSSCLVNGSWLLVLRLALTLEILSPDRGCVVWDLTREFGVFSVWGPAQGSWVWGPATGSVVQRPARGSRILFSLHFISISTVIWASTTNGHLGTSTMQG